LEVTLEVIQAIARSASVVSVEDTKAVLREIERTDALMPIVDPTSYMSMARTLPQHRRLVRAFLAFRRELDDLAGR